MHLLNIVTGAVGAALLPAWLLQLRSEEHDLVIRCVLTQNAESFVKPSALSAISGQPVYTEDLWVNSGKPVHKELAYWADKVLVAPASLSSMVKIGHLDSGSLALATVAFTAAPVYIVPAVSGPVVKKEQYKQLLMQLEQDHTLIYPSTSAQSISLVSFSTEEGGMASFEEIKKKILR